MYYLGRGKKESNNSNNTNTNNEDGDQTDNNKYTYARAKNTLASALLRFPGMFLRLLEAIDSKLLKNDDLKSFLSENIFSFLNACGSVFGVKLTSSISFINVRFFKWAVSHF